MLNRIYNRVLDRLELRRARRAYRKAQRACLRVTGRDDVPYGMWEALDDVRRAFGERLIDAEVSYLQGAN
jgi:hypothetical protein